MKIGLYLEVKREPLATNFQLFFAFDIGHPGNMIIMCIPIFLCHFIFLLAA
jgi:hypothetical protein